MSVARYGNTAALNNVAGTGNGFMAEGIAPSTVNDAYREFQARVRLMANELPGWIEVGSLGQAANEAGFVYVSGTQLQDASGVDLTATYKRGRRIRAVGSLTGDIQGVIDATSFSSPNNSLTIIWDSGSLSNETLTIYLGPVDTAFPSPIVRQEFTSSGTWNKPAGLKLAVIHCIGGGGQGGDAALTSASQGSEGGGGGGGEYAIKLVAASGLGSSETVTVGAGSTGSGGGNTSFGSLCIANGGADGTDGTASSGSNSVTNGGDGGTGGTGDLTFDGNDGEFGHVLTGTRLFRGTGGGSPLGGGWQRQRGNSGNGDTGKFPGGGGNGATNGNSAAASTGGDGAAGLVVVEEYFV